MTKRNRPLRRSRFDCIHCGVEVKADEEACCFHCGRATVVIEKGVPDYRAIDAGQEVDEDEIVELRTRAKAAEAKLAEADLRIAQERNAKDAAAAVVVDLSAKLAASEERCRRIEAQANKQLRRADAADAREKAMREALEEIAEEYKSGTYAANAARTALADRRETDHD